MPNPQRLPAGIPYRGRSLGRLQEYAKQLQCLFHENVTNSSSTYTWQYVGGPLQLCVKLD